MTLDVVHGSSRNRAAAQALVDHLRPLMDEGTIYLGYPVLATADERVEVDALAVSKRHGLVAFLFRDDLPADDSAWEEVIDEQDRLFSVLEGHLKRHPGLRRGRQFASPPQTATIFPSQPTGGPGATEEAFYGTIDASARWVAELPSIESDVERSLQAALQRVTTIKPPKKRSQVQKQSSRGAILREIEKNIANLDRWQKIAAIESPDSPQRIRGLAGSGKTVVLALKAAYWHTQHPDWLIGTTFYTRALHQQFIDLITRFTFEHSNDTPDLEQLRIVPAWGSRSQPGIYSMMAMSVNEVPRDFSYAQGKYGFENAFRGVCQELLAITDESRPELLFDAVLIDEAQDLPQEFFQLLYRFTKEPKRIVWAYDELQKLSESAMPDPDELFGTGPAGESLVSLETLPDSPLRDIVLRVCYRNTPWALATAHALGIGVYREDGLLQHPDVPTLWKDIGYDVVHGSLGFGEHVTLERASNSYPQYFSNLMTADDAVLLQAFPDEKAQDTWVASEIKKNLTEDELEADDILIVLPDAYTSKTRGQRLMQELRRQKIPSHLVGVNTSADSVFVPDSVAVAHIHRAKGNEAPMVYAVDSQYAARTFNAVTRRNGLFTAITRSRAWVRITGYGDAMNPITQEVRKVIAASFRLDFTIPTWAELQDLRHIYRERDAGDEATVQRATEGLATFLEAYERGEVELQDLPPNIRTRLLRQLQLEFADDDER